MAEGKQITFRRVWNGTFMKISGKRWGAYSIVLHRGRKSGRQYRNPVSAYPMGDGFVIPVLFGVKSQWVRNVMATGGFVLRTRGRDFALERPEVVPAAQAIDAFPPYLRLMFRLWRNHEFVWAHAPRVVPVVDRPVSSV